MVYLDNAATTFPKPRSVIDSVNDCIRNYCANSGRSSHRLAIITDNEIYSTREAISSLLTLNAPENVCFTTNATYAINMALKSLITKKCHILTSDTEHNSIIRPLKRMRESIGITFSSFSTDGDLYSNIEGLITEKTRAIASTLASNVTGKEIPIDILAKIAAKHKLILIADASQILGHKNISMENVDRGVICAPGHKGLFGIQGCGFAAFKGITPAATFAEGGSGSQSRSTDMPRDLPERLEAGTLPTPAIVSLKAGIEYVKSLTLDAIEKRIFEATELFKSRLADIDDLEIFACENGIISFRIKDEPIAKTASYLDSCEIYVREGLHCAPMAHRKLGTEKSGLIRVSLSVFNNKKDADALWKSLKTRL